MEVFIPRFFQEPEQSYFLFGPRGTGKTTYLKHRHADALWVDLLKPDEFRTYAAKPERIMDLVAGNPDKRTIIVDEIQKVPELLDAIHSLIEEKKNRKFILTGSSARKLKRAGVDLLAGRLVLRTFHPFLMSEISDSTLMPSFDHILRYGLLPIVLASKNPSDVLEAYVSLYLREEVQFEGLVRNIGGFSRFLEAVSFSHGSVINISNVARECGVERKVVEGYVKILEDILLAFRLPVFTRRAQRAVTAHPKFYLFDVGVYRTLRPKGPLDRPEEIEGMALEGLVAQSLRGWNAYSGGNYELYFWRSRSGVEVDFILYGTKDIYAIEVKNTDRIRPEDIRSLTAFRQDYPQSKAIFLYRGTQRFLTNQVLCIPCEEFLRALVPGKEIIKLFPS